MGKKDAPGMSRSGASSTGRKDLGVAMPRRSGWQICPTVAVAERTHPDRDVAELRRREPNVALPPMAAKSSRLKRPRRTRRSLLRSGHPRNTKASFDARRRRPVLPSRFRGSPTGDVRTTSVQGRGSSLAPELHCEALAAEPTWGRRALSVPLGSQGWNRRPKAKLKHASALRVSFARIASRDATHQRRVLCAALDLLRQQH